MAKVAVWFVLCVLSGTAFASEVRTLVASLCASNVLATRGLERTPAGAPAAARTGRRQGPLLWLNAGTSFKLG
jgi:hypothetical protein